MDGKDYYQILGVERSAATGEIRRRYLAMAKQNHPDHDGDTQQMMLLNAAYEVLSNPQSRFLYNNQLDDQEIAAAASPVPEPEAHVPYYYDEAPRTYNPAQKKAHAREAKQRRQRRPEKRSWAGRVMSFAASAAMIVIVGAVIAGHIPTTAVTSALNLTPSQSEGSSSDTGGTTTLNTSPGVAATTNSGSTTNSTALTDPATGSEGTNDTNTSPTADGTLQPTTQAETHFRCTLHYIASYKRMNCN